MFPILRKLFTYKTFWWVFMIISLVQFQVVHQNGMEKNVILAFELNFGKIRGSVRAIISIPMRKDNDEQHDVPLPVINPKIPSTAGATDFTALKRRVESVTVRAHLEVVVTSAKHTEIVFRQNRYNEMRLLQKCHKGNLTLVLLKKLFDRKRGQLTHDQATFLADVLSNFSNTKNKVKTGRKIVPGLSANDHTEYEEMGSNNPWHEIVEDSKTDNLKGVDADKKVLFADNIQLSVCHKQPTKNSWHLWPHVWAGLTVFKRATISETLLAQPLCRVTINDDNGCAQAEPMDGNDKGQQGGGKEHSASSQQVNSISNAYGGPGPPNPNGTSSSGSGGGGDNPRRPTKPTSGHYLESIGENKNAAGKKGTDISNENGQTTQDVAGPSHGTSPPDSKRYSRPNPMEPEAGCTSTSMANLEGSSGGQEHRVGSRPLFDNVYIQRQHDEGITNHAQGLPQDTAVETESRSNPPHLAVPLDNISPLGSIAQYLVQGGPPVAGPDELINHVQGAAGISNQFFDANQARTVSTNVRAREFGVPEPKPSYDIGERQEEFLPPDIVAHQIHNQSSISSGETNSDYEGVDLYSAGNPVEAGRLQSINSSHSREYNNQVQDRNAPWDPGDVLNNAVECPGGRHSNVEENESEEEDPDEIGDNLPAAPQVEHRPAEYRVFVDRPLHPQDEDVHPIGEIRGIRVCIHCQQQVLTSEEECPDCGRYTCSADCHNQHGCPRTFN